MRKTFTQGFTLIELLVVIAIIGLLSSVVLASLNTARGKGSAAKVQQQLSSMRSQAELYSGSGSVAFGPATCNTTANSVFESANDGLGKLLGGLTLSSTRCASAVGLPSNGSAWAVASFTSTGTFCVDSTGVLRSKTAAGANYSTTDLTLVITAGTAYCQ